MSYYAPQGGLPPSLPVQQQAASSMFVSSAQAVAQQDKLSRELFVGNTPQGTSELLLLHFLNAAMRRVGLCQPHETPIINARVSSKFSFIELVSSDMANKALSLTQIPFVGPHGPVLLKISRPSKYNGPTVPSQTWHALTGQPLPQGGTVLDPETEKLSRELFVGNTTPEMTEGMLRDFLGNALQQVGLMTGPPGSNPITACRVSGKFAFIELRSAQEATNALNLNNIPFMGASLRVGRPSKWNGPPDNQGNWEDILAKYMAGEAVGGAAAADDAGDVVSTTAAAALRPPSRVVVLQNMLTMEDLQDEAEYKEILEDTREECAQFGQLLSVVIPRATEPGATKIFLEYASTQEAAKAIQGLEGRTFDERRVVATHGDETKFAAKDFA